MPRIERKTRDEIKNLDEYNITQILRAFTRNRRQQGYGEDKTFNDLEPKVIQNIENFDMKSLSHLMHTYGFREQGSPHLHQKFLQRLFKNNEKLDHQTVSNIIYYLMFTDNKNEALWTQMVQHTLNNNQKVPLTNLRSFKMSRYYMHHHFPELDIRDYYDKFFFGERFYNTAQQEDVGVYDDGYVDFVRYLTHRFFIYPIPFVPFHNLFILRACFMEHKVAVNFF